MRIAINTLSLESAHQYRGIGFYTKSLIRALEKYQPQNQYIFFTRASDLPKNVDLVHYPFFDCFARTLPLFKKLPTVVTIHDLIPIIFPNQFPRGIKGEIKWQIQKFALKNVSAVITDSKNSKKDIHKLTGMSRDRIQVVYLAPGEEFKPIKRSKVVQTTLLKYNLPEEFILYVGDLNWNKNVPGLIKAFARLERSHSPEVGFDSSGVGRLVLIGKAFADKALKETQEINNLIHKLQITNYVLKLGFVPTEDLVKIYNLASVYIQPSFYEGFGLPVLEAMACGTPVVAADTPVLREVCGQAAIYIDPENPADIAKGIRKALELNDSNLPAGKAGHLALVKKGLKQAKKFSWKKVARETVKVYKRIC